MKLLNSTPITKGITFSVGYTKGCSVTMVHAKPTALPTEKPHYHSRDSEYFYVLRGSLKIDVEKKIIDVKEGMCLETQPKENTK